MSYVSLGSVGYVSGWQLEQWMNQVAMVSNVTFSTEGGDLVVSFHIGSSKLSLLYSADTCMSYLRFSSKAQRLDVIVSDWNRLTEGLRLRITLEKIADSALLEIAQSSTMIEYAHANEGIYFNLKVW